MDFGEQTIYRQVWNSHPDPVLRSETPVHKSEFAPANLTVNAAASMDVAVHETLRYTVELHFVVLLKTLLQREHPKPSPNRPRAWLGQMMLGSGCTAPSPAPGPELFGLDLD